jgi:hypothetical protein
LDPNNSVIEQGTKGDRMISATLFPVQRERAPVLLASCILALIVAVLVGRSPSAQAQTFDSGSNGSDGALNLTTPGTVIFDPSTFAPPLDQDGDNVFHFTTITIGEASPYAYKPRS